MSPDRENIEAAIHRVHAGELSPAEATALLLDEMRRRESTESSSVTHTETLSRLVARLGPPPTDVMDRWCERVERFAIAAQLESQSLPPIDPDRWILASNGDLVLPEHQSPDIDVGSVSSDVRRSARRHAALFRQQFHAQEKTERPQAKPGIPSELGKHDEPTELQKKSSPKKKSSSKESVSADWRRKTLIGGLLVMSVAGMAAILWKASRVPSPSLATPGASRPVDDGIAHRGDQGSPSTAPVTENSSEVRTDAPTAPLETFQPKSSHGDLPIPISNEWLSLDASIPPMPDLATQSGSFNASSSGDETIPPPQTGGPDNMPSSEAAKLAAGARDDPLADSTDGDEPDESPQPTRRASETAVRLPATDDAESIVLLAPIALASPSLEFPIEVGVELRQADPSDTNSPATWMIVETKDNDTLANIRVTQARSEFQWTPAAKRSSMAHLILHGSLRDASGQVIYLRPKVVSDPYEVSLDAPDARPSWDLLSPLPPRAARVSVELDLPEATKSGDGIELGWIEPVDSTSPRRTRGLAVLKPTDGETIEVGIRFDVQCSRKLSVRVRTFGRLDSSMPWQLISRPILEGAADRITAQATRVSQMSTEMSMIYSRAGSDQRGNLRLQRDAIEEQRKRLVEGSKRIAELQSLIDKIASDMRVRLRLWVQWPESQQDLLVMEDD